MANPVLEDAIGVVDGVNQYFSTSMDYTPGTLQVWINGILVRPQDADGFIETGSNTFQMKEVPMVGDLLRVFYIDTAPAIGAEVEELHARLETTTEFTGVLEVAQELHGILSTPTFDEETGYGIGGFGIGGYGVGSATNAATLIGVLEDKDC